MLSMASSRAGHMRMTETRTMTRPVTVFMSLTASRSPAPPIPHQIPNARKTATTRMR